MKIELNHKTAAEIITLLQTIPATTSLTLVGGNQFQKQDWEDIFTALPHSITSLKFQAIGSSIATLSNALSTLGENIASLEFIDCGSGENIIRQSHFFPETVTTLNLTSCPLPDYSDNESANAIFNQLNPKITSLGLRNSLVRKDGSQLTRILAALPKTLMQLDLGSNFLGNFRGRAQPSPTAPELLQALTAIKAPLTHLSLANNDILRGLTGPQAAALATALQKLISLDLSNTQFVEFKVASLSLFANLKVTQLNMRGSQLDLENTSFKNLPQELRILDYRNNNIGKDDLKYFKELPPGLTTIALNYENFIKCKPEALFAALPTTLSTLILNDRFTDSRVSLPNLISIIEKIPSHIKILDLSNNNLERFSLEDLEQLLMAIPQHVQHIVLKDNLLFHNKTSTEMEQILMVFGPLEQRKRFNLEGTGFPQLQTALLPIAMMVGKKHQTPSGERTALPINLWATILSYTTSGIDERIIEPCILEAMNNLQTIKQKVSDDSRLQSLKNAVATAEQEYRKYLSGTESSRGQRNWASTFFSSNHSQTVQNSILLLNQKVQESQTAAEAIQFIKDFLTNPSNKNAAHSPELFLADQIVKIDGLEQVKEYYPQYKPYQA
ncbi:TPA: hypothetical protein I9282_002961 [Legionella pneumophila]|uniref:hypothetical protein n=1 Tax=Legionella pneumophila TaxID=446 RepID=UPI000875F057|nr:hypothetical protein [Legionella pneumophila]AOW53804.1 hypothetical protein BE841_14895 [Legionella pneumophila subsp. pneumophila]AOW56712.1 hypothetical protein BE842_14990 [Legionella pneumophila subsp. pneumophila]AOW65410.1 hypothetical protein BE845_14940 [Legionella pneumophila subsp. pneumophila]HAT1704525.1 hypothetical protein [Legionella pneumophila]HAT4482111.1 hypothetical protein [Legionella pneumophila]